MTALRGSPRDPATTPGPLMGAVVTALGTMGAVVALGWLLGRRGVLGERAAPVLARVVFAVATPALLLTTVAHADLHLLLSRTAVVTWASTVAVALVAALVLRFGLRRSAADVTVGTLASSYVNAGNIGLPLAVYLLADPVAVVPTLLFQLLVLAPVAFTVLDARTGPLRPGPVVRRTLSNPIIVGTLVGLLLATLPWNLPEVVYEPFRLVGAAAAPLALLTFGMALAVPRTVDTTAPRADLALAVVLRAVVHPVLAWGLGTALGLPAHALLAVVAMAALPTAQNVLVYAMQYRRGEALARDAGLVTTVLCVPVLLVVAAALG
ncbi:AEC family transporter [Cellulomonas fengjieae]|uniref:AEC family transporter n=1 Tax=Cellulomonas fengjieae TaxID=2819978 RepID=A0ABS3SBU2_9CELL|nr:AEC family transporter [Cellulomonas fengjieae]MBO3083212.1 AEC family transporter [Cellulomonas fengjieae]QVI65431.1 AEC family transporter [Cellulomonas fengjieae]